MIILNKYSFFSFYFYLIIRYKEQNYPPSPIDEEVLELPSPTFASVFKSGFGFRTKESRTRSNSSGSIGGDVSPTSKKKKKKILLEFQQQKNKTKQNKKQNKKMKRRKEDIT
jgi:hypothetical protein